MLSFNGESLIERQVRLLRSSGIDDIIIIRGYRPEKIKLRGVRFFENSDYENTNMVATLFAAESEMQGEILVCYSDIVYEARVLQTILDADVDVGVVVDEDYLSYWKERLANWQEDLESLQPDEGGLIKELGTATKDTAKAQVRYVGLIKFRDRGLGELKRIYHENKAAFWDLNCPWLNSKSFKKAYMTDMLQAMINAGFAVHAVPIRRGWMEFDTVEDYEKAVGWLNDQSIERFMRPNQ